MNWKSLEYYWNVGKLIVEAQGGKKKAKYVNELLKNGEKQMNMAKDMIMVI